MALPDRHRVRLRQVAVSVGIVIGAVLTSAQMCGDPVIAEEGTVLSEFSIRGGTSSFAGDTLELRIVARHDSEEQKDVVDLSSTWTQSSDAVKKVRERSGGAFDYADFVLLTEGGSSVITATAGKGKMASGATPFATHTITVVGKPAKIVFVNAPTTIAVGERRKLAVELQDAQGRRIESPKMQVTVMRIPEGIFSAMQNAVGQALDTLTLEGIAPGTASLRVKLTQESMTRAGLTGDPISAEIPIVVTGPPASLVFAPVNQLLFTGQSAHVAVFAQDAAQNVLTGVTYQFTSLTPDVVSVSGGNGGTFTITALSNGAQPEAEGRIRVRATVGTSTPLDAEYEVTVRSRVSSVTISPGPLRLDVGAMQPLAADVAYATGTPPNPPPTVNWQTSNGAKVSVSAQGVVTALGFTGTTPATVHAVVEGVQSNSITVQVGPLGMHIIPAAFSLPVGDSRILALEEREGTGAPMPGVVIDNEHADWTSGNASIATVSTVGIVVCHAPGTTTITATLRGTSVMSTSTVTCIVPTPPAFMVLDPVEYTTTVGQLVEVEARLYDAQGNPTFPAPGHQITYASSATVVAELAGVEVNGLLMAKAAGTTTVTASYGPTGGGAPQLQATATLRVGSANLGEAATVRISQAHLLASPGVGQGLVATAFDFSGAVVEGATFRWSLANTNPVGVTVNQNTGSVSANSTGGATVLASVVLPGDQVGATGVAAVTVRTAGAILANVTADGAPAGGPTIRAWQNGILKGTGVVPANAPVPGRGYIPGLAAGSYTVTVTLPGFQEARFENVVVNSEAITQLNSGASVILAR